MPINEWQTDSGGLVSALNRTIICWLSSNVCLICAISDRSHGTALARERLVVLCRCDGVVTIFASHRVVDETSLSAHYLCRSFNCFRFQLILQLTSK